MHLYFRITPGTKRDIRLPCMRCPAQSGEKCGTVGKPDNIKKDKKRNRKPHALGEWKVKYD